MGGIDILDDLFDLADDTPPMNEALVEWAEAHTDATDAPPATERRPLRGPCSMCRNKATMRCLRCERPVCVRHHHTMVGICDRCMEDPEREEPEVGPTDPYADERPARRAELDLDWIE